MAHINLPVFHNWRRKSVFVTTLLGAGLVIAGPTSAQTVIIGGSGSSPVEINMRALAPASPVIGVPSRMYSPTLTRRFGNGTGSQDYSKSSQIVYGAEVINLVPPGSRPKKKIKTVVASKPVIRKKAAEKPKAPSAPKQDIAKAEAPKEKTPTKAPVKTAAKKAETVEAITPTEPTAVETPKIVAQKTAPARVESEPKKEIVITTKPAETKTMKVASEKSVPETKAAEKTTKETSTAPKTTAKSITPDVEPPQETAAPKLRKKEMQVASIAPETIEKPVAANSEPTKINADDQNQIFFEPEQTKLPNAALSSLKNLVGVLKSGNDRVQLVAYANANSNSAARRLSLGRALVVRSKLMELGVPNNKIEVRALGKPEDGSPADRVDLKLITR